jgi:Ribbon-helix-helix domain
MERKKVSTTVYITYDQNTMLKLLNRKTKVPIAEYIREGIDLVLERHRNQLPGQMLLIQDDATQAKGGGHLNTPPEIADQ